MRVLASLFILCIGFGVVAQTVTEEKKEPENGPKITFQEKSFDFGEINQGDQVSHVFIYENTGNEELKIMGVSTSCGCTASNWSREPLAPGAKAEMTINFNSRGKRNLQNKIVTITSNAVNATERIKITANVLVPEATTPAPAATN